MQKRHAGLSIIAIPLLALAAASPTPAQAATGPRCYVDADAAGSNTGNSWKNAYTDLQSALTDLNCTKIWVAEGLYKRQLSEASFLIPSGVELYGGFDGTETERSQRDPDVHITVLTGDIGGDDITDEHGVVLVYTDIRNNNNDHVLEMDGVLAPVGADTVVDGFTITAGQADGPFPTNAGGGLYCNGWGASSNECSPTLANLVFSGNMASLGGALYNDAYSGGHASPHLTNVTFQGNYATSGGALFNDGQGYAGSPGTSSPTFNHVVFEGNSATSGGAIYNNALDGGLSSPSLADVIFTNNSATAGGAMYNYGGAAGTSNPILSDVTFSANTATGNGGAVFNDGGGGNASPILSDVTFDDNHATHGGAMYSYGGGGGISSPLLDGAVFTSNAATGGGGALFNEGSGGTSSPQMLNVTFEGNTAASGGAMVNDGAAGGNSSPSIRYASFTGNSATKGGAIYNWAAGGTSSPTVAYSTFDGNEATESGGAIYNHGGEGGESSPSLANVTLWGNHAPHGGGLMNFGGGGSSSPSLTNVTFSGNWATSQGGGMVNYGVEGSSSPTLVNVIMWGDTSASGYEMFNSSATPTINYSVIQGGDSGSNTGTAFSTGTGNTSADPRLWPLGDYGGDTQTMAIPGDSSAEDAADGSSCPIDDQRGIARPMGAQCDIGAFEVQNKTMKSQAAKDGWVLESSESSDKGGSKDSTSTSFKLGDNVTKKQYRAILSFDTSVLPDAAEILSVELRIKKSGESGADPFGLFGNISVDMKAGKFGSESSLQKADFQATPGVGPAMILMNAPVDDWYANMLDNLAFIEIKKTGLTQFRLGFVGDDNGDAFADYLKFYSGDAGDSKRPQLIISYYVP